MRGGLLGLVLLLGVAAAAPADDPLVEAASAYTAFTLDVAAIGAMTPKNADDVDRALELAARHNDAELTRGWIAYSALVAAQSPAFVAGVQSVTKRYGRAAVLRALAADPAYPTRRQGYDEAAAFARGAGAAQFLTVRENALRWEVAVDAMPSAPIAKDSEPRARVLRALGDAPGAAPAEAVAAALQAKPSPPMAGDKRAMARDRRMRAVTALAAMKILGAGAPQRVAISKMLADPQLQTCIRGQQLEFYQCVSVTRDRGEAGHCLAAHGMEGIARCIAK